MLFVIKDRMTETINQNNLVKLQITVIVIIIIIIVIIIIIIIIIIILLLLQGQLSFSHITALDIATKCLKAGIEESFPRQRIETIASVDRQRLREPVIARTIVVARQRKNPTVRLGVSYSVGEELT
jgi:hypothetical protein